MASVGRFNARQHPLPLRTYNPFVAWTVATSTHDTVRFQITSQRPLLTVRFQVTSQRPLLLAVAQSKFQQQRPARGSQRRPLAKVGPSGHRTSKRLFRLATRHEQPLPFVALSTSPIMNWTIYTEHAHVRFQAACCNRPFSSSLSSATTHRQPFSSFILIPIPWQT